jgi:hypothetical protein
MQGVRLARNGLGVVIFGGIACVIEGMAQWVADRPQYCTSRKGWQVEASWRRYDGWRWCGMFTRVSIQGIHRVVRSDISLSTYSSSRVSVQHLIYILDACGGRTVSTICDQLWMDPELR